MVDPVKLLCAFDGDNVADIFNYTDHFLFTHPVTADITGFFVGYVVATYAEPDLVSHYSYRFTELRYVAYILFDQVKHKTQRRFFSYTRKPGKFVHCIFQ
jgi:hypothetical protein